MVVWLCGRTGLLQVRKQFMRLGGCEFQHELRGITMPHPKSSAVRALHEITVGVVRRGRIEIDESRPNSRAELCQFTGRAHCRLPTPMPPDAAAQWRAVCGAGSGGRTRLDGTFDARAARPFGRWVIRMGRRIPRHLPTTRRLRSVLSGRYSQPRKPTLRAFDSGGSDVATGPAHPGRDAIRNPTD